MNRTSTTLGVSSHPRNGIDEKRRQKYRTNGFAILPAAVQLPELQSMKNEMDRVMSKTPLYRDLPHPVRLGEDRTRVITNPVRDHPSLRPFVFSLRRTRLASAIVGEETMQLLNDRLLYASEGEGLTQWHQDRIRWPLETDHFLTIWIFLEDLRQGMGSAQFALGSHRDRELVPPPDTEGLLTSCDLQTNKSGYLIEPIRSLKAGDAIGFAGWTLHNTLRNTTSNTRKILEMTFVSSGTRIHEPNNPAESMVLDRQLPGRRAGDPLPPFPFTRGSSA